MKWVCDVVIHNNKYLFGSPFVSSTELLKNPKISGVLLLNFYWDDFWKVPKDGGWLSGEPTSRWEGWNLSPLPDLRGGERGWRLSSVTNSWWFNQSCLHNEGSIKTWKRTGFWELPVRKHTPILGEWDAQWGLGSSEPHSTHPALSISSLCCSWATWLINR